MKFAAILTTIAFTLTAGAASAATALNPAQLSAQITVFSTGCSLGPNTCAVPNSVPGSVFATDVKYGTFTTTGEHTLSASADNVGFVTATVGMYLGLAPMITVNGSWNDPALNDAAFYDVRAIIQYEFRVLGPEGGIVPVTIESAGRVPVEEPGGQAIFQVGPNFQIAAIDGPTPYQWNDAGTYNFNVGSTYTVYMDVFMRGYAPSGVGSGSNSAFIDPLFTLGTNYSSQGYALEFSPGVGVAAVPEPATWALLIGGFGAAGSMLRRRMAKAQDLLIMARSTAPGP